LAKNPAVESAERCSISGFGPWQKAKCVVRSDNMPWYRIGEIYEFSYCTLAGRGNPRAKGMKIYKIRLKIPKGARYLVPVGETDTVVEITPPHVDGKTVAEDGMGEKWFDILFKVLLEGEER